MMAFITRTKFTLGCVFLVLLGLAVPGWGQSLNGSLSGKVTDPSHASVPSALVTVQSAATGVAQKYTTGPDGLYTFPNLLRGAYTLTVEAKGFRKFEQQGITIDLNARATADVNLVVGATNQIVEVHANASPLNHESGEVSVSVPPSTIEDLPLGGGLRNAASFVAMLPGVTTSARTNVYSPRFAGGPAWGDDAVLDGASMVEGLLNPSGMVALADYQMNPDAISEMNVLTNNYDVQYGSSLGGVVTFETKAGTNQFHGDLYEFSANSVFNANAWGANSKPYSNTNDYGGTLGGPFHVPGFWGPRHKTYFFQMLDAYRVSGGDSPSPGTLPTAQERQGNFSDWLDSHGNQIPIYDPASTVANPSYNSLAKISATNEPYLRTQFPGNVIPSNYPNFAFANKWIQYLPANTNPGISSNYQSPPIPNSYASHVNESVTRVDEYIGSRDHFMASVRYSGQSAPKNAQQACALPLPICADNENATYYNFQDRLNWDHTFSPTVLNHFGASYSDFTQGKFALDAPYASKIPAIANVASNAYPPELTFSSGDGYEQIGNNAGLPAFNQTRRPATIYNDVLSWSRGKHLFKMGGEVRFLELNGLSATNLSGTFGFNDNLTGMPAVPTGVSASTTGNSFASFITGAAGSASSYFCAVCSYYSRSHQFSGFWGDTYKKSSKLTLSYGVRWDASTPLHEKNNDFSFFNPAGVNSTAGNLLGTLAYAGTGWGSASYGSTSPGQMWLKGFGPRFGFAYNMGHNTVLRGGYGIFYGAQFYNQGGISQTGFSINVAPPVGPNQQSPAIWMQSSGSACITTGMAASFCGFPTPPYYTPPPIVSSTYLNGKNISAYSLTSGALPYVQQFTMTVEHAFTDNLFVTATYTGSKGTRLLANLTAYNVVNPSYLGTSLATQMTQTFKSTDTSVDGVNVPYAGWWQQLSTSATACGNCTIAQALRPYPQYTGPLFPTNENDGNSFYNGFSFTVTKRTSHGLWFLANYNVQKNMGTWDAGGARGTSPENLGNVSQYYRGRTWTVQTDDVPQTLKLSLVYDLPFEKVTSFAKSGFGRQVLGGWEVSTIYIANGGIPWQIYAGTCTNAALFGAPCVPARLNGVSPYTQPESSFDPSTATGNNHTLLNNFAFEPTSVFTTGTTFGQGPLMSPDIRQMGYANEDASLLKMFPIKERFKFQIRADFLDMWNWHSFAYSGRPNGGSQFSQNISAANFGKLTGSPSGPRNIVLAGKLIW